jgi:hypothetical protein
VSKRIIVQIFDFDKSKQNRYNLSYYLNKIIRAFKNAAIKAMPGVKSWQVEKALEGTKAAQNPAGTLSAHQEKKLGLMLKEKTGKEFKPEHYEFVKKNLQRIEAKKMASAKPKPIPPSNSIKKSTTITPKKAGGAFSNLITGEKSKPKKEKNARLIKIREYDRDIAVRGLDHNYSNDNFQE